MKRIYLILIISITLFIPAQGQDMMESFAVHKAMEEGSLFRNIIWQNIGPSFQGGRVEAIDCPVNQPGVIYAGFGSGSLWKTTDQGLNWRCIFTGGASFSIGDVAVSPSDPETVYLGTGEALRASRGYTYPGSGIYRSSDAGETWTNKGLTGSQHIGRIVVDPYNAGMVFVAAIGPMWSTSPDRGLYFTMNGGDTWQRILHISDNTGVADVVWDHVNKIIYAAAWQMPQGPESGIYRSGNLGETWEKCISGFPENNGIGRIGLCVSPGNPTSVYAVVDNRNLILADEKKEVTGAEVYFSGNSGKNWHKTHEGNLDLYSGFGWAFGDIRVSPFKEKEIYVLGVHTVHSTDGGRTFTRLGGRVAHLQKNPGSFLHLDHHDLYLDPGHPERMILGSDGGIFITHDKGTSWLHCNTIPVGEFYDIQVSEGDPVMVYGGTQDNSSVFGPVGLSKPIEGSSEWKYVWLDPWSGGDGFITIPDPEDPDVIYYESQNGYLNRKNMVTGRTEFIQPKTDQDESPMRTSWLTPYFFSIHHKGTIYYGANKLYKSINRGYDWIRISPDLCYPDDTLRRSRAITAIAESPVQAGLLYAGTEKGALWVSRDDGIKWIGIDKNLPVKSVVQVVPSLYEEGRVYLVMKALDEDDYLPYLFLSDNRGVSWKPIMNGLPSERINCLLEDPELPGLIYSGTDRGVYLSHDTGKTWMALSTSLPTSAVVKLVWADAGNHLLAATHGQSIFSCFALPVRKYYRTVDPDRASILGINNGYLPGHKDFSGDLDWNRHIPLTVSWYQPVEGPMNIMIRDQNSKEIARYIHSGEKAINFWEWDLVLSKVPDSSLYPVDHYKFPVPGTYNISVQGQGFIMNSSIEVR